MFVDGFFLVRHHDMYGTPDHSQLRPYGHAFNLRAVRGRLRSAGHSARQKCTGCREATKQARGKADAVLIAAVPVAELAGSPKQVAWAATIRATRLARLQRAGSGDVAHLACFSDAKWWIDNRSADDAMLLACWPGV
jgi:hypothetical protein